MSYDYNALVSQIATSRRQAAQESQQEGKIIHLQVSLDSFATLSMSCPMTPLLWMQYASDTSQLLYFVTSDSSASRETRLQLLELALEEFPGSAILQLHYLQLLLFTDDNGGDDKEGSNNSRSDQDQEKILKALDTALQTVGKGSHRNEGVLIAAIYRIDSAYRATLRQLESGGGALQSFFQRSEVPMKDVNDGLMGEFQQFCRSHGLVISSEDLHRIEGGRRNESRLYHSLVNWEDEIDVAMHAEGILPRHQVALDELDWDKILESDEKTFWMGLGGLGTADAFIKYAQACFRFRMPASSGDEQEDKSCVDMIHALALSVYERGVAECPTVETIWLSYIRHLSYLVATDESAASRLQTVVNRAVRNCPYSPALFQQKLNTVLLLADAGKSVFDPDELMNVVQEAMDSKFITAPSASLDLHMTAIKIVRRRLLSLLSTAIAAKSDKQPLQYDDAETVNEKSVKSSELDPAMEQEIQDLCEDIREMYDAVDSYLRKNHVSWTEGRALLWADRASTETHLVGPLIASFGDDAAVSDASTRVTELIRCYEKLTKVYQPAHPDSFSSYVQSFLGAFPASSPLQVLSKLRQTRALYQKALKSVGKPKHSTHQFTEETAPRDFETALRCLCHNYIVFERCFGSEKSFGLASKAIQHKLQKLMLAAPPPIETSVTHQSQVNVPSENGNEAKLWAPAIEEGVQDALKEETWTAKDKGADDDLHESYKRKLQEESEDRPTKKVKTSDLGSPTKKMDSEPSADEQNEESAQQAEESAEKKTPDQPKHTARVGKLDYPAHPFTVRVSNLSTDTEDMDLIDTLRPKCGAIVHAKIVREKHQHQHGKGTSKGWGLVQFEERGSVEKALQFSEELGIRENLIKVERSHLPAAGLVPPGMHRVNAMGEGRRSRQNEKRREKRTEGDETAGEHKESKAKEPESKAQKVPDGKAKGDEASRDTRTSVLAFRPRGVTHSTKHRKVKLSLSGSESKK
jgi:RNA recognition motif-containing protein